VALGPFDRQQFAVPPTDLVCAEIDEAVEDVEPGRQLRSGGDSEYSHHPLVELLRAGGARGEQDGDEDTAR
jgi:hypothetical protein